MEQTDEDKLSRFQRFLREFNLFQTNRTDERTLRIQRWSTRLYIPILFSSLLIILVYTIIQVHSQQIQISNPSLSTYIQLYEKYNNIKCPCTEITISYEKFLQISPSFHQVCSSDLIDVQWIQFLYDKDTTTIRYPGDFRSNAYNQFQLLQQLCRLSSIVINDGIDALYQSQMISGELLNENLFITQVEADILLFQTITMANFDRSLSFMRQFIAGNRLTTCTSTSNVIMLLLNEQGIIEFYDIYDSFFVQSDHSWCDCGIQSNCHVTTGFYDFDTYTDGYAIALDIVSPKAFVDGWETGCWTIESLLVSTLQTFYNQTAFNEILSNINSSVIPDRFLALDPLKPSNYNSTDTLETLLKKLFVEKWSQTLNYSSYYSQCQPQFCEYDINERSELIYIITSLLGFYGGLSVVLRFIIPFVIEFIFNRLERRSTTTTTTTVNQSENNNIQHSFREGIENFWKILLHFNLYKNALKRELHHIKHQIWSTRIYLGLLSISFMILIIYSSVIIERRIIQINNPSLKVVQQLETEQYSPICPCTVWSVNYEYLFQLEPRYHQVCSSVFFRTEWFDYMYAFFFTTILSFPLGDFRLSSYSLFQLINSLCNLSDLTVSNALFQFGKTQLISSELLGTDLFLTQMNATIEQFQQMLPNSFLRLLQLLRNVTYLNQFIPGSNLNFDIKFYTDEQSGEQQARLETTNFISIRSENKKETCLCANNITCGTGMAYLEHDVGGDYITYYTLPNMYNRCYLVETLLASTMECFYDNNPCFEFVKQMANETEHEEFTPLNTSQLSHFPINVTIEKLLENLFVDSWSTKLLYSSYFEKCQPKYCLYSINQRRNFVEIITTITALIGGLSTIFKFVSPYIVSMIFYLVHRCQNRRQARNPEIDHSQNENIWHRLIAVLKNVCHSLLNLNIFENTEHPSLDESNINMEKQSTRLYFILLFLTIFILILYTSLTYRTNEIIVPITSLDSFMTFQNASRSMVVNCSCTKLSTTRSTFYQIQPRFHQVCSSDFVTEQWLNTLFESYQNISSSPTSIYTYNGTAFTHFQSVAVMCNLTKQAVIDAEELFLRTSVISSQMPNIDLFHTKINLILKAFQSSLSKDFNHSIEMFRALSQTNGFISVYSTNWNLYLRSNFTEYSHIYFKSQSYGECDCAISSACIQNSIPYVQGYVVGCLPIESYLRSTFECLYSDQCVEEISSYVQSSFIPKSLNQTQSRFRINTPINDLINEMLIESWSTNVSYENYFNECQLKSCSYILSERYNILYVMTTLLGLFGGINIILKLTIPLLMKRLYEKINRFCRRNQQVTAWDR